MHFFFRQSSGGDALVNGEVIVGRFVAVAVIDTTEISNFDGCQQGEEGVGDEVVQEELGEGEQTFEDAQEACDSWGAYEGADESV